MRQFLTHLGYVQFESFEGVFGNLSEPVVAEVQQAQDGQAAEVREHGDEVLVERDGA
jgi:hypothetical protein